MSDAQETLELLVFGHILAPGPGRNRRRGLLPSKGGAGVVREVDSNQAWRVAYAREDRGDDIKREAALVKEKVLEALVLFK